MAIVSESYFATVDTDWDNNLASYCLKTSAKGKLLTKEGCAFIDFGTRRRRSYEIHDAVVRALKQKGIDCLGTSNLHFAMRYGMNPVGTMAHEWIMAFAGIYGVENANRKALEVWREVYGDDGVALTDTYTTSFFRGHQRKSCSNMRHRHDSECPFDFADQVLSFYEAEGIDAGEKESSSAIA